MIKAIKRYELRFLVGAGAMWTEIIGHQWENTGWHVWGTQIGMIRLGSCFVSMCGAICQAEDSFLARDVFQDKSAHGCITMQGGQLRA